MGNVECKCSESKPTALHRHAAYLNEALYKFGGGIATPMLFPMYVVPLDIFLQMKTTRAHQQMLHEGKLVMFENDMGKAIFVSHQWVGSTAPDPDFSQLQVLQEALRNLMSGKVSISPNMIAARVYGTSVTITAADFTADPLFIWYDYFSCPQPLKGSDGNDVKQNLSDAIDSIPGYVEMCHHFVILTPALKHIDQGSIMSYNSWKKRGWCRAERAARFLSTHNTSMIIVESPIRLELAIAFESLWCPVGSGDFTQDAGKRQVGHLLKLLLTNKLQASLAMSKFHEYRVLLNLQRNLLQNLPIGCITEVVPSLLADKTDNDAVPPGDEQSAIVQEFMHQNGFTSIDDRDEGGWTPLCFAALNGDHVLIQGLLKLRADVNDCLSKSDQILHFNRDMSVLTLCAMFSNNTAMKLLIAEKADLDASDCIGVRALSAAGHGLNCEGIKILMESRCNPELKDLLGLSPVVPACVWGSHESVAAFIEAGVPVSGHGMPLLHASMMNKGDPILVQRLLEARADIDEPLEFPLFQPMSLAFSVDSLQHSLGSISNLNTVSYNAFNATPLIMSVATGSLEAAQVLIDA
ncbi:unnamed protein product [Polarella glacialis]|uniref:Uncharacterized protein n=2 Tax=Polarella glacialis TaxID=89957 RepID=A0A813K353_POLGL|nr:unnamed protein product [Polarella glacialis]